MLKNELADQFKYFFLDEKGNVRLVKDAYEDRRGDIRVVYADEAFFGKTCKVECVKRWTFIGRL
ncbi:MAG: hypothetical protein ACXVB4_01620 [Pseudobdellovibrionaceae bacterium]